MKLMETIGRCEKLVLEEIECYDFEIEWYLKNIGDTKENRKRIQKWNEDRDELLGDLNNLRFIANEVGLKPIALEDREPQLTDLDDEDCCWWWCEVHECWERFDGDMGGIVSMRECNEMDAYPHQYTHWVPGWAIKTPLEKNEINEDDI